MPLNKPGVKLKSRYYNIYILGSSNTANFKYRKRFGCGIGRLSTIESRLCLYKCKDSQKKLNTEVFRTWNCERQ